MEEAIEVLPDAGPPVLAVQATPAMVPKLTQIVDELDQSVSAEEMILVLGRIVEAQRELKVLKEKVDEKLLEKLKSVPGRSVKFGTINYYVGSEKKVKCRNVRECIVALMEKTGGDFDLFTDTLSVNAIKQGAAKKVLGDEFAQHFETVTEEVLEKKETLHVFDEKFKK